MTQPEQVSTVPCFRPEEGSIGFAGDPGDRESGLAAFDGEGRASTPNLGAGGTARMEGVRGPDVLAGVDRGVPSSGSDLGETEWGAGAVDKRDPVAQTDVIMGLGLIESGSGGLLGWGGGPTAPASLPQQLD